jgi:hypothetical protein
MPPQICNTGFLVVDRRAGLIVRMKRVVIENQDFEGVGDQGSINAFFFFFFCKVYTTPAKISSFKKTEFGIDSILRTNMTKVVHMVCKKSWKCGREGMGDCGCDYP